LGGEDAVVPRVAGVVAAGSSWRCAVDGRVGRVMVGPGAGYAGVGSPGVGVGGEGAGGAGGGLQGRGEGSPIAGQAGSAEDARSARLARAGDFPVGKTVLAVPAALPDGKGEGAGEGLDVLWPQVGVVYGARAGCGSVLDLQGGRVVVGKQDNLVEGPLRRGQYPNTLQAERGVR